MAENIQMKNIVISTDGSEHSKRAYLVKFIVLNIIFSKL